MAQMELPVLKGPVGRRNQWSFGPKCGGWVCPEPRRLFFRSLEGWRRRVRAQHLILFFRPNAVFLSESRSLSSRPQSTSTTNLLSVCLSVLLSKCILFYIRERGLFFNFKANGLSVLAPAVTCKLPGVNILQPKTTRNTLVLKQLSLLLVAIFFKKALHRELECLSVKGVIENPT